MKRSTKLKFLRQFYGLVFKTNKTVRDRSRAALILRILEAHGESPFPNNKGITFGEGSTKIKK